jgi:cyclophilin family peptidyl-prolyl cis-trans isomerase
MSSATVRRLVGWALGSLCAAVGCRTHAPAPAPAEIQIEAASASSELLLRVARAEDRRRARELPTGAQDDGDVALRRASARALARVLDTDDRPLLRALDDEDPEVVAWAAYGLGESCHGREEAHVPAIAARLVAFVPLTPHAPVGPEAVDAGASSATLLGRRVVPVMLRALGRCGGPLAERTLVAWLAWLTSLTSLTSLTRPTSLPGLPGRTGPREGAAAAAAAAYGLGDIAARQSSLSDATAQALLDAAHAAPHVDAAFAPFVRPETAVPPGAQGRLATEARAALARPGPERLFAVRAIGRAEGAGISVDLARLLVANDAAIAERVEAARALGRRREAGDALANLVVSMVPERVEQLGGGRLAVIVQALASLSFDLPPDTEDALWSMVRLDPGSGASPATARRASALRCAAAVKLAKGAWDSDVLRRCDIGDGEIGERARLAALDRGWLVGARRQAWSALARSGHLRVREAALDAIERHPELADAAKRAVADGLASDFAGVVATAAKVLHSHPDRVLDPGVDDALRVAFGRRWTRDLVETRAALVDAAAVAGIPEGRAYAEAACGDPGAVLRARAVRALIALGAADARCDPPDAPAPEAPEIGHAIDRPVRIVLETDAGPLALRVDPSLAPVAATRVVALAREGFYTGTPFLRVAPGFVVQFGDRGGDGFGGSGDLLRCETSPVPFEAGDVGVALAGRDTGSSQLFVTLARYPHLDGEYAWVGRAEGDWNAVTEGDLIRVVRVEP